MYPVKLLAAKWAKTTQLFNTHSIINKAFISGDWFKEECLDDVFDGDVAVGTGCTHLDKISSPDCSV